MFDSNLAFDVDIDALDKYPTTTPSLRTTHK